MEIITFVPDSIKENPYIADIAELAEARNAAKENGQDPQNVGTVYTWSEADFNKERVAFSKAANLAGFTARLRLKEESSDDEGNKSVKATFTLTSKHAKRRNKEREHAAAEAAANETSDNTDAETPAEVDNTETVEIADETAAETVETPKAVTPRNRKR